MRKPVIVGVDGSASANRAAELGGALAVRHDLPLELLHAFSWPIFYPPILPESAATQVDPRTRAREVLELAAADGTARYPDLPVATRRVDGNPAGVLVDASRRASFVVVGHRGLGGFAELLVGSVGVQLTTHAYCPVIVVRGDSAPPNGPVLVGVDGSIRSRAAARVAFEQARARGSELVVGLAWPPARSWPDALAAAGLPPHPAGVDPVAAALGHILEDFPDVEIRREVRHGDSAAGVLTTLAAETGAAVLVVGSRGIGGFRGLLMGGTCRALIDHSPCPLLVVPKHVEP